MKKILYLVLFVFVSYLIFYDKVVEQPPGVLVFDAPVQKNVSSKIIKEDDDYVLNTVASYDIKARVLAKKNYSDKQAEIAPLDLALGWQKMSSNELLSTIKITQSNRFYFWYTQAPNYPRREIETQSANTHIIASNKYVEDKLKKVSVGDVVHMKGYLVNAKAKKSSMFWNSSTTRNDTGNGACELMYVESVEMEL